MTSEPNPETTPVTVLSGVLGAGKTTLLNRLLENPGGRDIAAIVNDMGEINVDADLLARGNETGDRGIVDLSNGCICCRLRNDLVTEAARLAETRNFDVLVVESSGISEPIPVARALTEGTDESDIDPTEFYRLDTMVSVVDSYGFWKAFDAGASLPAGAESDEERPLADVMIDGIEFCDLLVCNKCDLVPDDELEAIEATIRTLQPRAEVVRTTYAEIDPERVLDTGRFDFADAAGSAGWKRALAAEGHDHADRAAEAHGVSSFVYARDEPFHPERLDGWLDSWADGVVRAKGVFWLVGRDDVLGLNHAGPSVEAGPIGTWGEDDPRTRLVFIGAGMDEDEIVAGLDGCLVTDDEATADPKEFDDPFPTA